MNGGTLAVQMEALRSTGGGTIVAWRWYCLGEVSTASDYRAKFRLAVDRLARRDDTSAWVAIFVVNPESVAAGERYAGGIRQRDGRAAGAGVARGGAPMTRVLDPRPLVLHVVYRNVARSAIDLPSAES